MKRVSHHSLGYRSLFPFFFSFPLRTRAVWKFAFKESFRKPDLDYDFIVHSTKGREPKPFDASVYTMKFTDQF